MVDIRVPASPGFSLAFFLVLLPKLVDQFLEVWRRLNLFKADLGQIHHRLWLSSIHEYTIIFKLIAIEVPFFRRKILLTTRIEMVSVHLESVSQGLHSHFIVHGRSVELFGVSVVIEMWIIGRDSILYRKRYIDSVGYKVCRVLRNCLAKVKAQQRGESVMDYCHYDAAVDYEAGNNSYFVAWVTVEYADPNF